MLVSFTSLLTLAVIGCLLDWSNAAPVPAGRHDHDHLLLPGSSPVLERSISSHEHADSHDVIDYLTFDGYDSEGHSKPTNTLDEDATTDSHMWHQASHHPYYQHSQSLHDQGQGHTDYGVSHTALHPTDLTHYDNLHALSQGQFGNPSSMHSYNQVHLPSQGFHGEGHQGGAIHQLNYPYGMTTNQYTDPYLHAHHNEPSSSQSHHHHYPATNPTYIIESSSGGPSTSSSQMATASHSMGKIELSHSRPRWQQTLDRGKVMKVFSIIESRLGLLNPHIVRLHINDVMNNVNARKIASGDERKTQELAEEIARQIETNPSAPYEPVLGYRKSMVFNILRQKWNVDGGKVHDKARMHVSNKDLREMASLDMSKIDAIASRIDQDRSSKNGKQETDWKDGMSKAEMSTFAGRLREVYGYKNNNKVYYRLNNMKNLDLLPRLRSKNHHVFMAAAEELASQFKEITYPTSRGARKKIESSEHM